MPSQSLSAPPHSLVRHFLAESIDYAGLFPPATLAMDQVVRHYHSYRTSGDRWALGRLVIPANRLEELAQSMQSAEVPAGEPWLVSALLGPEPLADMERIEQFNAKHAAKACVDSCEGRLTEPERITAVAKRCESSIVLYCELPSNSNLEVSLNVIKTAGARAKIRMGGVTPDLFPHPEHVLRFLGACVASGIPFKATAGLHHPFRSTYPLTYEPHAPTGVMYGFLNLIFATTAVLAGKSMDRVSGLLLEEHDGAFQFTDAGVAWEGMLLSIDDLRRARNIFCGFGSCSFREPIDDLTAIRFLS